jgi:hypothetical protein
LLVHSPNAFAQSKKISGTGRAVGVVSETKMLLDMEAAFLSAATPRRRRSMQCEIYAAGWGGVKNRGGRD